MIEQINHDEYIFLYNNSDSFSHLINDVRSDLYSNYSYNEFFDKYRKLLNLSSETSQRSAEIYCWKEESIYEGILTLHYYDWVLIAQQLCYKIINNRKRSYIQAVRFLDLITSNLNRINKVADIATIWVQPRSRNKGIGADLFNFSLKRIKQQLDKGDYYFMAAVSNVDRVDNNNIFQFILDYCQKNNSSDQTHSIAGCKVPLNSISQNLEIDIDELSIDENAKPIELFALRSGMKHIGYFRTFSKIFGAFVQ